MKARDTSILVVNGGENPTHGRWLSLFLSKLTQYTDKNKYQLIVWNNNVQDAAINDLKKEYSFELLEPLPNDEMFHPHAVPLQRLYHYTISRHKPKNIIVMDSDALPIKKGWFEELTGAIDSGKYLLAGIWRDELIRAIPPYSHPSCICFSTEFVQNNNLRLDYIEENTPTLKHDTMSCFTDKAKELGGDIFKWTRSNKNNFHRLMGGIYGDYIYHHGAGSRANISFWDEEVDRERSELYHRIKLRSSYFLFHRFESFISWLRGENEIDFEKEVLGYEAAPISIKSHKPHPSLYLKLKRKLYKTLALDRFKQTGKVRANEQCFNNMDGIPTEFHIATFRKPYGWVNSFPDIVGLGVPKAGTSWWFDNLLSHPHIVPHIFYDPNKETSKELNFFSHIGTRRITEEEKNIYKQCFLKQGNVLCAEFSTIYLQHNGSLSNLLDTVGEKTRFVILLRNPVDRYISHVNHLVLNRAKRLGLKGKDKDLFYKYSVVPEATYYSLYADSLEFLLSNVALDRVFIDTYENMVQNPQRSYQDFIGFLGLPSYRIHNFDYTKRKNKQELVIEKPSEQERAIISKRFLADAQRVKKMLPHVNFEGWDGII